MNRMHPGKPPSQRREPSSDWKNVVYEFTIVLAHKLKTLLELDDPTARYHVIRAVRLAINESNDPQIDAALAGVADRNWTLTDDDRDDEGIGMTSAAFRLMLDKNSLNRKDLALAESIMQVVVETLDGECGFGWRTKVERAVRILVRDLMKSRNDDKEIVRATIIEALDDSLSDTLTEFMVKTLEVAGPDSSTSEEICYSAAGVFRMILECEEFASLRDMTHENFRVEAIRSLDSALSNL